MKTQLELEAMHEEVMDKIQMYASGLLTLLELQEVLSGFNLTFDTVFDLIDPASGLRYRR